MARPEGEWVIVSWTTAREGQTQLGDAGQRLERFTHTCDEGPCDIEVTPGGVDGTYLPEGITPAEGQDPSTEPSTLVWDEASGTYTRQIERLSSCTTESGVVPDGYMVTSTGTFTFVPPTEDAPARLEGTLERTVAGTPVGLPQGCTDFQSSSSIAGSPVDADLGEVDLTGTYVVTENVEATEGPQQRPPGFTGVLLPDAEVAPQGDGYTVAGILVEAPATLTEADGGWSGSTTDDTRRSEGEGPGEFDSTETWTDLRPVTVTGTAGPVLAGRWELIENPNDAGVAAGCSFGSNTGWVIFVPTAAVG